MEPLADRLAARFDPSVVSWRIGSTNKEKTQALALAYIDARDVMERLDEVCGIDGWACRYSHVGEIIICEIGLWCEQYDDERRVPGEWVWKADGAGQTDIEGEKGGCSDAFKRAAVRWGIGRYLYGLPPQWVDIEAYKGSHRIKPSQYPTLVQTLRRDAAPAGEAIPRGDGIVDLKKRMRQFALDLADVHDMGALSGLLRGYKETLDECANKLPVWWDGDGHDIKGAAQSIADKRSEILKSESV